MASRENYHVFLRPDIGAEAVQFFSNFVRRINFKSGASLEYLLCSKVVSGGAFLEVIAHPPDSDEEWPFQIPHYMVLVISGPIEAPNPIGFITGDA